MKTLKLSVLALLMLQGAQAFAQQETEESKAERYQWLTRGQFGNTLNAGLGLGYYGYVGQTVPVLHLNYEIAVANSVTVAPFLTYFSYRNGKYRQTVIPVGVKGSYYFDNYIGVGPRWDLYLGASVGVALRDTRWDDGYAGNRYVEKSNSGLYLDAHAGAEFHVTSKVGLYIDLSTGISTFGLSVHM